MVPGSFRQRTYVVDQLMRIGIQPKRRARRMSDVCKRKWPGTVKKPGMLHS